MSQYVVITPDGKRYGPTDFPTLAIWAEDGRVGPGMMVEDLLSGQTMTASAVPGLAFGNQEPSFADYPRADSAASAGNTPTIAMILGIVGMVAWCLPIVGFPVGAAAVIFGIRSLKSTEHTKAVVAIVLGSFCLLFSLANAIIGALIYAQLQG